jgi:hypothetical protein
MIAALADMRLGYRSCAHLNLPRGRFSCRPFFRLSAGYGAGVASPINHWLHGSDTVVFYRIAYVLGFVI